MFTIGFTVGRAVTPTSLRLSPNEVVTVLEKSCPCCDSPRRPGLTDVRDPDGGQVFAIDHCLHCGMGITVPIPNDLDAFYQQYHGGRHGLTTRLCDWRRTRMVKRFADTASGRLLDVGCGEGTFLLSMRSKGWSVVGVDTHPQHARESGLTVLTSLHQAAELAPFDCITLWHALEHFPDANEAVESIRSLIRPDGLVVLAVPNYESVQAKCFGRHWLHLDVPRHVSHFTTNAVGRLAKKHGMTATRLRRTEFEYDLMGWVQSGLNAIGLPANLLLKLLMRRDTVESAATRTVCVAWGCLIGALALLPTIAGCILGRGGTLVIQLRPTSELKS